MSHGENDYALVIGVDHYPAWANGGKDLQGACKDATDFRDWLVDPGGGGLPGDHVRLIESSANPPQPLQDVIDGAFGEILAISAGRPRRRFYFYFGGHGFNPAMAKQQVLCLASWSHARQGAAMQLESYIKAAVGCNGFEEGLYFLDCCRVRVVAPGGRISDFECGQPDYAGRHVAILYGTEQFEPGLEGPVGEDIRGYFTAALLEILREGPIELTALYKRLQTAVPEKAKPKKQEPRLTNETARDIILGPSPSGDPSPPPPPGSPTDPEPPAAPPAPTARLTIELRTNLVSQFPTAGENTPPPLPGDIHVLRDGKVVAQARGHYSEPLPHGTYQIVVLHGGAATEPVTVALAADLVQEIELPRRRSVAPLSSTLDKHEWITDPLVGASRWIKADKPEPLASPPRFAAEQAIFVARRQVLGEEFAAFAPDPQWGLRLVSPDGEHIDLEDNPVLVPARPGTWTLRDAGMSLPVPVAPGWDTQVFVAEKDGQLHLHRASIFMRKAGEGFDPADALLDAYETALADLVTGGPGPDPTTLDSLLHGKWHNPLFGLVGAHFLLRTLRSKGPGPDSAPYDLDEVIANMGRLLGEGAPDVVALQAARAALFGGGLPEAPDGVPLLRAGMTALIEATAIDPEWLGPLENVALSLVPGSPWACWRRAEFFPQGASRFGETIDYTLGAAGTKALAAIETALTRDGLEPKRERLLEGAEALAFSVPDLGDSVLIPPAPYRRLARIPDWLVDLVADEREQSARHGRELDLAALTRRTGLPRRLLRDAARIGELAAAARRESPGEMVEAPA